MPAGPATIVFTGGGSVNSRALQIAGITDDTPDPPGGRIQRDVDGAGRAQWRDRDRGARTDHEDG